MGGRSRTGGNQFCTDRFAHTNRIREHIIVPEAHHAITARFKPSRARFVVILPLLRMLPAVELDDEPAFGTEEIDDVAADWRLSAEAETFESPTTEKVPQLPLRIGRALTQIARQRQVFAPVSMDCV